MKPQFSAYGPASGDLQIWIQPVSWILIKYSLNKSPLIATYGILVGKDWDLRIAKFCDASLARVCVEARKMWDEHGFQTFRGVSVSGTKMHKMLFISNCHPWDKNDVSLTCHIFVVATRCAWVSVRAPHLPPSMVSLPNQRGFCVLCCFCTYKKMSISGKTALK
jgi:hypothetical protein